MARIAINKGKTHQLAEVLRESGIPAEEESRTHSFSWNGDLTTLANCYFAIVAICHQTSPIGERRLEGYVGSIRKHGWDYLKEKFLVQAMQSLLYICILLWALHIQICL